MCASGLSWPGITYSRESRIAPVKTLFAERSRAFQEALVMALEVLASQYIVAGFARTTASYPEARASRVMVSIDPLPT